MSYRIVIKKKDGGKMIANNLSRESLNQYVRTAQGYGDRVISIERTDNIGNVISTLFLAGGTAFIGLTALQAISNIFSK